MRRPPPHPRPRTRVSVYFYHGDDAAHSYSPTYKGRRADERPRPIDVVGGALPHRPVPPPPPLSLAPSHAAWLPVGGVQRVAGCDGAPWLRRVGVAGEPQAPRDRRPAAGQHAARGRPARLPVDAGAVRTLAGGPWGPPRSVADTTNSSPSRSSALAPSAPPSSPPPHPRVGRSSDTTCHCNVPAEGWSSISPSGGGAAFNVTPVAVPPSAAAPVRVLAADGPATLQQPQPQPSFSGGGGDPNAALLRLHGRLMTVAFVALLPLGVATGRLIQARLREQKSGRAGGISHSHSRSRSRLALISISLWPITCPPPRRSPASRCPWCPPPARPARRAARSAPRCWHTCCFRRGWVGGAIVRLGESWPSGKLVLTCCCRPPAPRLWPLALHSSSSV